MLAKLSLIFNISLAWVVGKIYNQKEELGQSLVMCHIKKYEDFSAALTKFNYLKHRVKEGASAQEINKELDEMVQEQKMKVQQPIPQ